MEDSLSSTYLYEHILLVAHCLRIATVLNINEGNNRAIMEACDELRGYAHLTALYRKLVKHLEPREAMDAAIATCMEDGLLVDYLALRRSEVIDLLLAEWKEDEYREMIRREAKEDGFEEGFDEGRTKGFDEGLSKARKEQLAHVATAVRSGIMSASDAASIFGCSEESIAAAM